MQDPAQRHARHQAGHKNADKIQSFADRKDMKKFFDVLNTVYGQGPGTTHSLLQMNLDFWLTKKLS